MRVLMPQTRVPCGRLSQRAASNCAHSYEAVRVDIALAVGTPSHYLHMLCCLSVCIIRPLGFDPDSKLIKKVRSEIQRARKNEESGEEALRNEVGDGYHTPDEEDEVNRSNNHIDNSDRKQRSISPGENMVYEDISEAFGFKKRHFQGQPSKHEQKWNR